MDGAIDDLVTDQLSLCSLQSSGNRTCQYSCCNDIFKLPLVCFFHSVITPIRTFCLDSLKVNFEYLSCRSKTRSQGYIKEKHTWGHNFSSILLKRKKNVYMKAAIISRPILDHSSLLFNSFCCLWHIVIVSGFIKMKSYSDCPIFS